MVVVVQNPYLVTDKSNEPRATGTEINRLLHDLNNLLAVIRNHAELLADDVTSAESRDDVAAIQEAVTDAASLVERTRKIAGTST